MAVNNLNTGGLEEAKEYMMNKEIPQLFESMMTALMYKKPPNHIQFLEDCLQKAKHHPEIKWHSFIDPLPPIPKSSDKIRSEHEDSPRPAAPEDDTPVIPTLAKKETPLPPIASNNQDFVVKSQNDTNSLAEKAFNHHDGVTNSNEGETDVISVTEKVFGKHLAESKEEKEEHSKQPAEKHSEQQAEELWYTEYTQQKIDVSKAREKPVIFVLGGPGSGKGTQCAKIVEKYGFTHLSAGDLLRKEVSKGTSIGLKIDAIMKEGQLVPQDVTICLLKSAMAENEESNGFLIDGFPREIKQGKQFEREVCFAELVLNYDCPDEVLINRLLARAAHSGRTDDNKETIEKRLALFHEKTTPVIEHYADIVANINADDTIDNIFIETCKAIKTNLFKKSDITKPVIFVLGGPGSGKGTQCSKLSEKYGFAHFSAGDLLRTEATKENEIADMIKNLMKEGQLVPQEITIGLLRDAIVKNENCNGYLIDGFPREHAQGLQFEMEVCEVKMLLYYECSDDILISRLLGRAEHSGREDDNRETITKRLELFHTKTTPLLLNYQNKVKVIDASKSIEDVYEDSCVVVDSLLKGETLELEVDDTSKGVLQERSEVREQPTQEKDNEEKDASLKNEPEEAAAVENLSPKLEQQQQQQVDEQAGDEQLMDDQMVKESVVNDSKPPVDEDIVMPTEEYPIGQYGHSSHLFKEEFKEKNIIVAIGGPGTERNSKCETIARDYNYTHIYTGDLLKAESNLESERGEMLSKTITNGDFVPQSVVLELIRDALLKSSEGDGFLLDGYPRTKEQAEQFEAEIGKATLALYFSISSAKLNEPLAYDDSIQLKNRIVNFEEHTLPLVEHYRSKGILNEIPANDSNEQIVKNIKNVFIKLADQKMSTTPDIIFVLGGPGCGKGTQCAKIVEKYNFCHLSTGDLLREEVQSGTERAEQLKATMERGELVSQETILELLGEAMAKQKNCKGFIIDGFPRDVSQGVKFEDTIGKCKFVLYFDCSNAVMTERLLNRAKTSGRVDDNEETIKMRLKTFNDETLPVLQQFNDRVKKVNAERDVGEIFADVCIILDTL